MNNVTIEQNSEEFITECRKKTEADEAKLLTLIEDGIDIHHRVYREGSQRFDDGNYWGGCFRLMHYALDTGSAKVIERLLEEPEIESELLSGEQCVYWGYSNAAWLRDIFYYVSDKCKYTNFDTVLSVLLSSPKLKSRNLFEEGFKCLSEKEQEKWVNRALCDNQMTEWKKDALMSTWVFPISKKEDLNLLPQLKQAEKIKIVEVK